MMKAVVELRKLPLFVPIGLMWWAVLLGYDSSRPFILYTSMWTDLVGSEAFSGTPVELRAGLSLVHALAAGWVVVRWLQSYRGAGTSLWGVAGWSILLSLFAVVTWWIVLASTALLEPSIPIAERFGRLLVGMTFLIDVPWLAFTAYWKATWIIVPLAAATVLLVRQDQGGGGSCESRDARSTGAMSSPPMARSDT